MPIITASSVATSTSARVCINLSHIPAVPTSSNRPTITTVGSQRRVACQASSPTTASITHHGVARSRLSRWITAHSKVSEILRNISP
ncbi:hypothetical protein D3C72_2027770 [compost metagenome]